MLPIQLGKETLSSIIIGDFNVPFSTFTTFSFAKVRSVEYFSYRQAGSFSNFNSYINLGSELIQSASASVSLTFSYEVVSGSNQEVSKQGTTSEYANKYYLSEKVDTGPYTTSISDSGSFASSTKIGLETSFIPNGGFILLLGTSYASYSFSDYVDDSRAAPVFGSATTRSFLGIRSTRLTTLTDNILGSSTTWTDKTTTFSSRQRTYTDISATTEFGTAIDGVGFADDFVGEELILQPHYGTDWTKDGSSLEYMHIFTTTGTFGPFHTSIIKDNTNQEKSFPVERTLLSSNLAYRLGQNTTYTVISSSGSSITWDYLTTATATLTFGKSYGFSGVQFSENTASSSSYTFAKITKAQTSTSYIVNDEVLLDGQESDSDWNHAYYKTTKVIQISSTDVFYAIDQNASYFSSFTYRGIINSTSSLEYILLDVGIFGSGSTSSSESSSTRETGVSYTVFSQNRTFFSESFNSGIYARVFYKRLYSIEIGTQDSAWTKYYTQYSPNFKYVVGGESNSINGYKDSLLPTGLITKLYFTTYKFERGGAVNAPILAIPIDYTSVTVSGTQSLYTYQSVNVPSEFCLGSDFASVYWTQSVAGGTTNTTSSFTLVYGGGGSVLKLGEFNQNDFEGGVGEVPYYSGIYHTIGLVNTANGAGWTQDGYYYWKSNIRGTSGTALNAISVVGDGQPVTCIFSEWTPDRAFPVAMILKSHANSYAY